MCMVCVPVAMCLFPVIAKEAFYFMLVPYLNKDFLQGRSPAKRLLGLSTNELRAFLRNVTAMLWPVEVRLIALGCRKRLGDYIAGTQVVASPKVPSTHSWYQDLVAYQVTSYTLYYPAVPIATARLLHLDWPLKPLSENDFDDKHYP
jgi:uncharacterized RDD family membrane protein YckC